MRITFFAAKAIKKFPFSTSYPGFSRPDATLLRERNHYEQTFSFPSRMRVHVMPTSKRQMASLPLVSQKTLGT